MSIGKGPNKKPNRTAELQRAERLILAALDCLLNYKNFDITFINQWDLSSRGLLTENRIDSGALADFADILRREFGAGDR